MLISPPFNSTKQGLFLLYNLKLPLSIPSSADGMSLTVKLGAVLPVSALVIAEVPGVRAILASLIPVSLGVEKRLSVLTYSFVWSCCATLGLEKHGMHPGKYGKLLAFSSQKFLPQCCPGMASCLRVFMPTEEHQLKIFHSFYHLYPLIRQSRSYRKPSGLCMVSTSGLLMNGVQGDA